MSSDCTATALQYPVFHPDRSMFYNVAVLVPEIYTATKFERFSFDNAAMVEITIT